MSKKQNSKHSLTSRLINEEGVTKWSIEGKNKQSPENVMPTKQNRKEKKTAAIKIMLRMKKVRISILGEAECTLKNFKNCKTQQSDRIT